MDLMRLFSKRRTPGGAEILYDAVVRGARQPAFYARWGVPDTVDGRFEMIALHAFLVLRRLKDQANTAQTAQALCDVIFADMDDNLREMGAGDLGVGRRVKAMAQAFYGRIAAYEDGLSNGDAALCGALARNVYGTVDNEPSHIAALAAYVRCSVERLGRQSADELATGHFSFGPPTDSIDSRTA